VLETGSLIQSLVRGNGEIGRVLNWSVRSLSGNTWTRTEEISVFALQSGGRPFYAAQDTG